MNTSVESPAVVVNLNAKDNKEMNNVTWFRTSDVTPFVDEQNQINIWNGRGYCASWGSCNVTSKVQTVTADVVKVDVIGWHKHTISPVGGCYYFVNEAGRWVRRTANAKAVKAALAVH
jgi:hypothetical protein